jgi:phage antirepressor YoqD-like protein
MNIPNLTIRMSHKSLKVSNNDYMLWLRQNGYQNSKDYEEKQRAEYGESYTFNSSKFSFLN